MCIIQGPHDSERSAAFFCSGISSMVMVTEIGIVSQMVHIER